MEYIFEIVSKRDDLVIDTSTCLESCLGEFRNRGFDFAGYYISVLKNGNCKMYKIASEDDLLAFQTAFDRNVWKDQNAGLKIQYDPLEETDGFHVKNTNEATNRKMSCEGLTLGELKLTSAREGTGKSIANAVDPSHYKAYLCGHDIPELQWLEAKQYQKPWRDDPNAFIASVLLQSDKYTSRLGGKDDEVQEIMKSVWYLKFLAAFIANGKKPIRIKDIDRLIANAAR